MYLYHFSEHLMNLMEIHCAYLMHTFHRLSVEYTCCEICHGNEHKIGQILHSLGHCKADALIEVHEVL